MSDDKKSAAEVKNQRGKNTEAEIPIGGSDEAVQQEVQADKGSLLPEQDIQQLRLELDEYKNLYLRKAAEFENFKKRTLQEYKTIVTNAEENLITDILPVLDDFERLLNYSEAGRDDLLRGAQMIRDKFVDVLAMKGLEPIESEGKPFDPEVHEALMQESDESVEPGIVIKEHLRGYRLRDRVIRHAQVVVSG